MPDAQSALECEKPTVGRIECQPLSKRANGHSSVAGEKIRAGEVQIVQRLKRLDFDRVQTHSETVFLTALAAGHRVSEIRIEKPRQLALVSVLVFEPAQVRQPVSPLALRAGADAEDERFRRICQQCWFPIPLPSLSCRVWVGPPVRAVKEATALRPSLQVLPNAGAVTHERRECLRRRSGNLRAAAACGDPLARRRTIPC